LFQNALYNQPYLKMKILNQINSMILKSGAGEISDGRFMSFLERVKEVLFS